MKTENYHQDLPSSLLPPLPHRHCARRNKKLPYMHRPRNQQQMVWVPTIPRWEKEFCLKNLGISTWEKFLDAKQYLEIHDSMMQWDDSGAEEAFKSVKSRFLAAKQHPKDDSYNQHHLTNLPDNSYVDDIKWHNNQDDPALYDDIPDSISQRGEEDEEEEYDCKVPEITFKMQTEYVNAHPSGWDVDVQQSNGDLLTGFVVGN